MRIDLTCPVELWQYALPTESSPECTFVMNNLSNKVVVSVMVTLNCYNKQDQQLLRQSVARLDARERQIITMRYGLDGKQERTQKEVAEELGISQSYISRLEKRIIARLKKEMLKLLGV